jgi:hypothetical protein
VALDAGTARGPDGWSCADVDELFVAVVRGASDGPSIMVSSLWLKPGLSIAESIALQLEQSKRLNSLSLQSPDEVWRAWLGMGRAEVTARLLNLVLYLCADATDVTRHEVPSANPSSRSSHRSDTVVLAAGFRLGAALRTAPAQYSHTGGEGTGNRSRPTSAKRTGTTTGQAARCARPAA